MEQNKEEPSEKSVISENDQSLFEVNSRTSLASHVDWNNKREIEKYCQK